MNTHPQTQDLAEAIDPVCGMSVDPNSNPPTWTHAGQRFFFCSDGCFRKFETDPKSFLARIRRKECEKRRMDPVCGMVTDSENPEHEAIFGGHAYHFCSRGCRERFVTDPAQYLDSPIPAARDTTGTTCTTSTYTCPMHPEIHEPEPGTCPICGMALEPVMPVTSIADNPEVRRLSRHFWICVAL
ncbi:copper-transporting ATPase, partial [mine drainage metagenome]